MRKRKREKVELQVESNCENVRARKIEKMILIIFAFLHFPIFTFSRSKAEDIFELVFIKFNFFPFLHFRILAKMLVRENY